MEITVNKDDFERYMSEYAKTGYMNGINVSWSWLNTVTDKDINEWAARLAIDLATV